MKLRKDLPKILVFALFPIFTGFVIFVISPTEELFSKVIILASISVILSFVVSFTYSLLSSKEIRGYGGLIGFSGNLLFLVLPLVTSYDIVFLSVVIFDLFFVFCSLVYLLDAVIPGEEQVKKVKKSKYGGFWEFAFDRQLFFYVSLVVVNLIVFFLIKNILVLLVLLGAIFIILLLEEFVRFYYVKMLGNYYYYSGGDRILDLVFSKFYDLSEKLSNTEKFVDALSVDLELRKTKQNELKISISDILEKLNRLKELLLDKKREIEDLETSLNVTFGDLSTNVLAIEYSISKFSSLVDEVKEKIGDILSIASKGSVRKVEVHDALSKVLPVFESLLVKVDSAKDVLYDLVTVEGKISKIVSYMSDEVATLSVIATNVEIEASRSSRAGSLEKITSSITESAGTIKKLVLEVLKLHDELLNFAGYLKPVADSIYKHSEKIKMTIDFLGSTANSIVDIASRISQDLINSSVYFDEMKNQISNISHSMDMLRNLLEKFSSVLNAVSEFKDVIDIIVRSVDEVISHLESVISNLE